MSEFTVAEADRLLEENFAPWVQDLAISFENIGDGSITLRVPPSVRLNRQGGTVCGQAIMALADTAMVFAVASAVGGFVPMTTVNQTASFLRPAADADLLAEARIIKRGKAIMYGEVTLHTGTPDKPIAHVTSTYMLL
jgi:uncharacterized protein (TIGR00369 family)